MVLKGFTSVVTYGQQFSIGENPTVIPCVYVCSSHLPIKPQPYPVIYVFANPVSGLLDRKKSEEYL